MKRNHERSLPREIISKILIELPAKYVMRFSCVSRTWLSIIEDPYFVESHHARSYTRPGGINLIVCQAVPDYNEDMTTYNVFYTNSEGKSPRKRLKPPDVLGSSFHPRRSSSVHGLVCAGNCIWNPTTNESIVLPPISLTTLVYGEAFSYAYRPLYYLGFDSSNNSYKVLCILQIYHSTLLDSGAELHDGRTQVFKVLVVGGSSWRDVESVPAKVVNSHFHGDSCSVDNLICFFESKSVLVFDVRREKFKKIPIPDGLEYVSDMVQVGGCISLLNKIMWILEDYKKRQWRSERLEIGPMLKGMKPDGYMTITPLGANHNGEILFEIRSDRRRYYYYYDIETKIGRKVFKMGCI